MIWPLPARQLRECLKNPENRPITLRIQLGSNNNNPGL